MPNIYTVFSHPHATSTTHAISRLCKELGTSKGYHCQEQDLYKSKFSPVLSAKDMIGFRNGKLDAELQEEQDRVSKADLLVFSYPIWWAGMPAILKGWIDRVFSYGFAYEIRDGEVRGLLKDKKALIINTHGQSKEEYRKNGMFNAMNIVTDIGVFDFCGIEVIEHLYYEEGVMSTDERRKLFEEIETDLTDIIPESSFFEEQKTSS